MPSICVTWTSEESELASGVVVPFRDSEVVTDWSLVFDFVKMVRKDFSVISIVDLLYCEGFAGVGVYVLCGFVVPSYVTAVFIFGFSFLRLVFSVHG